MKKKNFIGVIAVIMVLAMILSTCKEEEAESGWLTIRNLPSVPSNPNGWGRWRGGIYYDVDIVSRGQMGAWTYETTNRVADFMNANSVNRHMGASPFPLSEDGYKKGFLRNGTFLVQIFPMVTDYDHYFSYMNVEFKNGRATIDFNDMVRRDSLP